MIEDDSLNEGEGDKSESRLARWSRRKAQQQSQAPVAPQDTLSDEGLVSDSTEVAAVEVIEVEAELPVLTDADMPPVESLHADSDFSGFLSPGVSEELRKLALRKMFALPSFQIRDGLDDYDDDFTVFEPLGDTVTNDPWTHRQKRLAEEKAAAEKAEAERLSQEENEEEIAEQVDAEEEADALGEAANDEALVDDSTQDLEDESVDSTIAPEASKPELNKLEQDTPENE